MTKNINTFRLKYLFSPAYMAGRLSDIKSVPDALRRIEGILVYAGYRVVNGFYVLAGLFILIRSKTIGVFYEITGFFIFTWRKTIKAYYIIRGLWILGGKKTFDFARGVIKAPIYIAHFVLKVGYRIRGCLMLARCKFEYLYYTVRGFVIRGRETLFNYMRFIANDFREMREKIIALAYKLQFFCDIYRDFRLRTGLRRLKPIIDSGMDRKIPLMETVFDSPLRVLWMFYPYCTYKCPYCSPSSNIRNGIKDYVRRSKQEYIRCWDNFNRKHGSAQIDILGGEPFNSPDFPDILAAISVKNTISIITNLSWDPKMIIGRVDPAKVSFLFSYHPKHEPSAERFIDKIIALQRAGFPSVVGIVAWPPYFSKLPSWLKEFYNRGIYVLVEPFIGNWKGRAYPKAYTSYEMEAVKNINGGKYSLPRLNDQKSFCGGETRNEMEVNSATSFQLSEASPKGKLCNAGVSYFNVLYNGAVRRCSHGERLGEFFSGNYSLLRKPEPCPFDDCSCLGENLYSEGRLYGPKTTMDRV